MIDQHHGWNVSVKPLYIGLVLSLLLIFATYRIVAYYHLTGPALIYTLYILGALQAILQLIFFLHIGLEDKPRWNLLTLLFTIFIVILVIAGSVWIMNNLKYNEMPKLEKPANVNTP